MNDGTRIGNRRKGGGKKHGRHGMSSIAGRPLARRISPAQHFFGCREEAGCRADDVMTGLLPQLEFSAVGRFQDH